MLLRKRLQNYLSTQGERSSSSTAAGIGSTVESLNGKNGNPAIHHPESNAALDPMEMKIPLRSSIAPALIGLGTPPDSASASELQQTKTPNRNKNDIASIPTIGLKTPPSSNNTLAAHSSTKSGQSSAQERRPALGNISNRSNNNAAVLKPLLKPPGNNSHNSRVASHFLIERPLSCQICHAGIQEKCIHVC
mmetsp:Transcript_17304/g.31349  ORF Transcript_17304/g.31349 Transcript_17304/m.31349 type:complete len:192 (+) Transcript_17304:590-1165(+)